MTARTLPNGKPISPLGFGCSSIWSKPSFPFERAQEVLEEALARGINHFDTAPSYSEGEARLARCLRDIDRSKLVISTKVGTEHANGQRSFDPSRMRRSFEQSLGRLGCNRVDILYLHGPPRAALNEETFAFFESLKAEGRIDYSGVNSFDPSVVEACIDSPVDCIMLQYSLTERRFDTLIRRLSERGKIVIAGTILSQGIFDLRTFLPRDRKSLWYLLRALKNDPAFPLRSIDFARRVRRIGAVPHEAAIRFAVGNPWLTSSLFGTSNPAHVGANVGSASGEMNRSQIEALVGRRAAQDILG